MKRSVFRKRLPSMPTPRNTLLTLFIALIIWCIGYLGNSFTDNRLPTVNQPVSLYANQMQDDLRIILSRAIESANKSVSLVIYALTDEKVISTLRKKSEEGVNVRVVCDAKASPYVVKKLGNKIDVVRRFSPGLMHQKILVIDNEQVWIGSANMTGESLRTHGNLVTAINCPELAKLLVEKAESMPEYDKGPKFSHKEFLLNDQLIELWLLPDDSRAVKRLIKLIDNAQKTIRVAMFTWTRFDLANAVIAAKRRGVNVQVVIDHNSGKGASSKVVDLLARSRISPRLSTGYALLHHKFLYIDSKILVNGSANWTKAAFTQNDDCFIILHDLTQPQQQLLDSLWDVIQAESKSA